VRALKYDKHFNNEHWFMPSDKKKCYSYVRWSSDKQSGNSSLERQVRGARAIAVEHVYSLKKLEKVRLVHSKEKMLKLVNPGDSLMP